MNVRLLKAKRVERGILQSEVAKHLDITPKSACEKENSERCRYTVNEMLKLAEFLCLNFDDFDSIFFEGKLTDCTNIYHKNNTLV